MIITAAGEGSFKLQVDGVTIVTEGVTEEKSHLRPDIFLRTSAEDKELPDAHFIIKGPGEYELKDITITGIPPFTYSIKNEDMKLCMLSSADQHALDALTNIDILFIARLPQDNGGSLGHFIRQLNPRIVIASENAAHPLTKELGLQPEKTDKVTIKKRDIPGDGTKLICLTA